MTPGLPRSDEARLARVADGATRTSLLSVPADLGLRAVGFEAVGDVLGCATAQIRHQDLGSCGYRGPGYRGDTTLAPIQLGGTRWGRVSTYSYPRQLRQGYATALRRLGREAQNVDADGVVGIRLSHTAHDAIHEFVAFGTAVRSRSRTRPGTPFRTDLDGPDVAALLLAGWVPVSLHVAVEVGIRHDYFATEQQVRRRLRPGGNIEVTGYSELLQKVKQSVRAKLRRAIATAGADGALLSGLTTANWDAHCLRAEGSDRVVRTVATGTSIAHFARSRHPVPQPLTILPVRTREPRS